MAGQKTVLGVIKRTKNKLINIKSYHKWSRITKNQHHIPAFQGFAAHCTPSPYQHAHTQSRLKSVSLGPRKAVAA